MSSNFELASLSPPEIWPPAVLIELVQHVVTAWRSESDLTRPAVRNLLNQGIRWHKVADIKNQHPLAGRRQSRCHRGTTGTTANHTSIESARRGPPKAAERP